MQSNRVHRERNEGCLSRALPHEMVFTLLGRDEAASATIRFWVSRRINLSKNIGTDSEIQEALDVARIMDAEREAIRKELGK